MNRTRYDWLEVIGRAVDIVPVKVECDWFTGADPVSAGLSPHTTISDGRSYRDTAHTLYSWHATDRRTTIVLPGRTVDQLGNMPDPVGALVHEIGHVVDEAFGFDRIMEPVTSYAETDRSEAFAEAFARWLVPAWQHRWWESRSLAVDDVVWLKTMFPKISAKPT